MMSLDLEPKLKRVATDSIQVNHLRGEAIGTPQKAASGTEVTQPWAGLLSNGTYSWYAVAQDEFGEERYRTYGHLRRMKGSRGPNQSESTSGHVVLGSNRLGPCEPSGPASRELSCVSGRTASGHRYGQRIRSDRAYAGYAVRIQSNRLGSAWSGIATKRDLNGDHECCRRSGCAGMDARGVGIFGDHIEPCYHELAGGGCRRWRGRISRIFERPGGTGGYRNRRCVFAYCSRTYAGYALSFYR